LVPRAKISHGSGKPSIKVEIRIAHFLLFDPTKIGTFTGMSDQVITCRFVFTSAEYRKALRCYWRYSPLKWWMLALVLIVLGTTLYPAISSGTLWQDNSNPASSQLMILFWNLLPFLCFFGFISVLLVFQTIRVFRKGPFFNQEMIYLLRESGVHMKTPSVQTDINWELFPRAVENENGFAVFFKGRRSFNWLPKKGFAQPENIDQCRQLLRQCVKDARKLYP
jgi:hypothetical protein